MENKPLKVLECFAGLGACSKALTNLGIPHEIVDAVEIDKYAIKSFNAIHGTNFESQDITKWDKDVSVDLIMSGSPCQDFSVAGLQAGGDKDSGTRSSLMYETIRIIEKLKPKYVVWENVKNLLSKKHRHNFDAYLETMEKLGYKNTYKVLNAADYGIPQHRERVFTISIREREREREREYVWPEPIPLEKKLKDILEGNVDEKYYLSDKQLNGMIATKFNQYKISTLLHDDDDTADTLKARFEGCPQLVSTGCSELARKVCNEAVRKGLVKPNDAIKYTYSNARLNEIKNGYIKKQNNQDNEVMSTLKTNPSQIGVCVDETNNTQKDDYIAIKNNTKLGYLDGRVGDGVYTNITTKRGTVQKEISPTLTSFNDKGVIENNYRIRKLTPKECWRLQGFSDDDFDKAKNAGVSSAQLYKQAGNSITVDVLMAIFNNLFKEEE